MKNTGLLGVGVMVNRRLVVLLGSRKVLYRFPRKGNNLNSGRGGEGRGKVCSTSSSLLSIEISAQKWRSLPSSSSHPFLPLHLQLSGLYPILPPATDSSYTLGIHSPARSQPTMSSSEDDDGASSNESTSDLPSRILILYASETGNAQDIAERTGREIRRRGGRCLVQSMVEFDIVSGN